MKDMFARFQKWMSRPRTKKRMYVLFVLVLIGWVLFRFAMVNMERRLYVFNPMRNAAENGVVVDVMRAEKTDGVLKEPITIKNNRGFISGARVGLVRPGQHVGNGVIVSVANTIDYDTGMHVVKTRGVSDGLNFAEYRTTGYFVPMYAINNGMVMIADNGIAVARPVTIARTDADMALVSGGISDGDVIILSSVKDGTKIQIKK